MRVVLACLLVLAACGDDDDDAPPAADAAPADAGPYVGCNGLLDGGPQRGIIVRDDGACISCDYDGPANGDDGCVALAGTLADGCRAYCRAEFSLCYQSCAGVCTVTALTDAGPDCTPGQHECAPTGGYGIFVCDPTCGPGGAGGCRTCAFDDECEAELGPSAHCQRHCSACCSTDADAGVPCSCI